MCPGVACVAGGINLPRDLERMPSLQLLPCAYVGNPAYPPRLHLQCPFGPGMLSSQMITFNEALRLVTNSVKAVQSLFRDLSEINRGGGGVGILNLGSEIR